MSANEWKKIDDNNLIGGEKKKMPRKKLVLIIAGICAVVALIVIITLLVVFLTKDGNEELFSSITSITEVYGDGQKVKGVSLKSSNNVKANSISIDTFSVDNRNITEVYVSEDEAGKKKVEIGPYIYIGLNINDTNALTWNSVKNQPIVRKKTELKIRILQDIELENGEKLKHSDKVYENMNEVNITVDDFEQFSFEKDSRTLPYNLFTPKNISSEGKYPLVMFIHDAGTTSVNDTQVTLIQGIGATIWASEEDQAKRPCFVIAPQFDEAIVNDSFTTLGKYDLIMPMLNDVIAKHPQIDTTRIYTTGQSMGCMSSIALMIENPNFFAAAYYVAGQWDPEKMKALVNDTFWIVIAEADPKAPPIMDEAMSNLEALGANITRAMWDGHASEEQKAIDVEEVESHGTSKNYIKYINGTVIDPDQEQTQNHMGTWKLAYNIVGVRDWIFKQKRRDI